MNVQLWKLAQSRLLMNSKSGGDVVDRGAIQIGDLPATAFMHDDMEDQVHDADKGVISWEVACSVRVVVEAFIRYWPRFFVFRYGNGC